MIEWSLNLDVKLPLHNHRTHLPGSVNLVIIGLTGCWYHTQWPIVFSNCTLNGPGIKEGDFPFFLDISFCQLLPVETSTVQNKQTLETILKRYSSDRIHLRVTLSCNLNVAKMTKILAYMLNQKAYINLYIILHTILLQLIHWMERQITLQPFIFDYRPKHFFLIEILSPLFLIYFVASE